MTNNEYNNKAVLAYKQQRYKDAEIFFTKAIELDPSYAEAYSNLGAIHSKFKNYKKAIELYKKAIELKPSYAGAYTNLGNALNKSYEYEEAVHYHNIAIKLAPNESNHYSNIASAYKNLGRFNRAISFYKKAIELNPNNINAHFDLSTVLLQVGEFKEGFEEYEWRMKKEQMGFHLKKYEKIYKIQEYNNQDLRGKKILIHSEQGFGDSLMVARYVKIIKDKGANVTLYLRDGLGKLFETLECSDQIVERCDDLILDFDYQISFMSLMRVCDPYLEKISEFYPYLKAQNSTLPKLKTSKKLKVALVWGASNTGESYDKKVLKLRGFKDVLELKDIEFYSLQVGEDSKQLKEFPQVIDLSVYIKDFSDTAHFINELDLVISADTSVAHLSGAMGANTWVLLQKVPDWRWGVDGSSSIWYKSVKLFRQHSDGYWDSVYKDIKKELLTLIR